MKILIDPGHGGSDPGAVSKTGQTEARTNLNVALALRDTLGRYGHSVIMTRTAHETTLSIEARQELIKQHKPGLFISVHHNGSANQTAHGAEVIAQIGDKPYARKSYQLAGALLAEYKELGQHIRGIVRKPNSAGSADYYGVLRTAAECAVPAVITEYAFMTEKDLRAIDTLTKQKQQAKAIARAVWAAFATKEDKNMLSKMEAQIAEMAKKIDALKPAVYDRVEDVPEWARPVVARLSAAVRKILQGGSSGKLGLSYDMLRILVILDRAGALE